MPENNNCIKCAKLLIRTKDNLLSSRCENSVHLKCSRLSQKTTRKEKQNSFANFALNTLVLNVTGCPVQSE